MNTHDPELERGIRIAEEQSLLLGGPVLSVEFSLTSRSGERAGCRSVIEDQQGVNASTRSALVARANLDDAIEELRTREGASSHCIVFVDLGGNTESVSAPQQRRHAYGTIQTRAQAQLPGAPVWMALASISEETTRYASSVEDAIQYLKAFTEPAKVHALKYARKARPKS